MLSSGSVTRIKRHKDSLHAIVAAVEKSKRKVEELKIASGEEIAAINAWGDKVEEELTAVDKDMDSMAKYLSEMDQEQVEKSRREQLAFEKELFEQKLKFNQELEGKSSSNTNQNKSHVESQQQGAVAKLPKITITKFNGTNLDWTRFWGQFTEGIDKSNMAAITKFSYLKELSYPRLGKASMACHLPPRDMRKQRVF